MTPKKVSKRGGGDAAVDLADSSSQTSSAADVILAALSQSEGYTRAELVRATSLPRSTVSAGVRRLKAEGKVEEFTYGTSTGGRRPTLVRRVHTPGCAYVAELGEHHARIGLATVAGKLLATQDVALRLGDGQAATIEKLAATWRAMGEDAPEPVVGVGLAVPGPVDQQGRVTGAARMPGWNEQDLPAQLAEVMKLPVVVENDARAGAVGEWLLRGEHEDSCIYVKAGTGIGAGWISGGKVHRGTAGFAGDITHLRIQTDNPLPCSCGNSGCLETVASGAAILRQLAAQGSQFTSLADVIEAAKSGDQMVTPLVRMAGARLGEVLSGMVNFLNPFRIVVGGSMSQIGGLLAGMRTELYDRCLPMATEHLAIETSQAGADAPLLGMSVLVRQLASKI